MNTAEQIIIDKMKELPPDKLAEVEDFVDFLRQRKQVSQSSPKRSFALPVDHTAVLANNISLSRQDMYNDDGR